MAIVLFIIVLCTLSETDGNKLQLQLKYIYTTYSVKLFLSKNKMFFVYSEKKNQEQKCLENF